MKPSPTRLVDGYGGVMAIKKALFISNVTSDLTS